MKKENLQSRRDFFKKAAKDALPILGAIILAGAPTIVKAATKDPMGCKYSCAGTCQNTCSGSCRGGCSTTCYNACYTSCKTTCQGTCRRVTKY